MGAFAYLPWPLQVERLRAVVLAAGDDTLEDPALYVAKDELRLLLRPFEFAELILRSSIRYAPVLILGSCWGMPESQCVKIVLPGTSLLRLPSRQVSLAGIPHPSGTEYLFVYLCMAQY